MAGLRFLSVEPVAFYAFSRRGPETISLPRNSRKPGMSGAGPSPMTTHEICRLFRERQPKLSLSKKDYILINNLAKYFTDESIRKAISEVSPEMNTPVTFAFWYCRKYGARKDVLPNSPQILCNILDV